MPTNYTTFTCLLMDSFTGKAVTDAGTCIVTANGATAKATLYDPDSSFASLANPISFTAGRVRFAVSGTPIEKVMDIYGMTSTGRFFVARGIKAGDPTEIPVNTNARDQVAIIPFDFADAGANTEKDTGIAFPTGALVGPIAAIKVTTVMAAKTLNVGTLSTQSGGDADGFLVGVSLAALATVKGTLVSGAVTLGALLQVAPAAGVAPEPAVIGATAKNVSYTLAAASTAGGGYIILPYVTPAS